MLSLESQLSRMNCQTFSTGLSSGDLGGSGGWMPIDEACTLYNISIDEFLAWERDLDRNGPALRAVRQELARRNIGLTEVRILDLLIFSAAAAGRR